MDREEEKRKDLTILREFFKNLRNKVNDSTSKVGLLELLKLNYNVLSDLDLPIKTKQYNITAELAFSLFQGIRYLLLILKPKLTENEY